MTDEELIARLRKADEYEPLGHDGWEAADRIEALTAERDEWMKDSAAAWDKCEARRIDEEVLEAKLAKAVEALERIAGVKGPYSHPFPEGDEGYGAFAIVTARATLAEIKGESHD